MATTDDLIARLVAEQRPVRLLASPWRRAALWMALAVLVVAAIVVSHGLRPDLVRQMARPAMLLEWLAGLATGVTAALATFQISLPDRSPRWLLLPLPPLALWLATLSLGCLADLARLGPAALDLRVSWACLAAIATTSLPLGLTLLVLVRHAGVFRPRRTAALGGLAVAAFASAGLSLFHDVDTTLMVLVWHGGAVTLVVAASALFSRRLFAWIGPGGG